MDSCPIPLVADLPTVDYRFSWVSENLKEICQKAQLTISNQTGEKKVQLLAHHDMNGSNWNVLYELGSNNEAELSLQVCAPSQIVNGGRRPLAIRANVLLSKGAEMDPFTMIEEPVMCLHAGDSKTWKLCSVLEILRLLEGAALKVEVILETFDYSIVLEEIDEEDEELPAPRVRPNDFLKNFGDLLEDERSQPEFSDFQLLVKGKAFHLHKAILAVRCPLFRNMVLKNGHTDSQIAEEMASGLSSRTVEILVRFVYSGKLILNNQDNLQILEELLPASVKWGIFRLLKLIDVKFSSYVTVQNAYRLFELASIYELDISVTQISAFIAKHRRDVFEVRKAKCPRLE